MLITKNIFNVYRADELSAQHPSPATVSQRPITHTYIQPL